MKLTKNQKYNILIEEFKKRNKRTLDTSDEVLKERLGNPSTKTIQRLIEEFMLEYQSIVEITGTKRKTYKLINPIDLITESFEHFEDIGWLFNMAHDANPEIFKELEQYTQKSKQLYLFKSTPFEDLTSLEAKDSFRRLKRIIQSREYAKIKFFNDEKIYDNLKCLKLVFMDNNWYVAFIDKDKLQFGRISFIQRVDYGTKIGSFQPSTLLQQMHFLQNIQNSMTLYDEKKKIATIKATKKIAPYFENGMKTFLSTQKFKEKLGDGSIIFTLEYTQDIEILPFIQKWLPDLVILEPLELKDTYLKKLQDTVNNHS